MLSLLAAAALLLGGCSKTTITIDEGGNTSSQGSSGSSDDGTAAADNLVGFHATVESINMTRSMGRDKVCSRKTVPELRDIKHRAAEASKRRSVGRRAVGTPGLLWKMQRSGSQGNLFAFLGNMSYFCRVSADRPPPPTDTPPDTPPHLRGAIRTQLFNRTKTIRPQCVCRPEPVPKSLLTGRNGRRILSAWR